MGVQRQRVSADGSFYVPYSSLLFIGLGERHVKLPGYLN